MARRVHSERPAGLLYGQRAPLIGALEPLTYTATMLSTRSAERPYEQLAPEFHTNPTHGDGTGGSRCRRRPNSSFKTLLRERCAVMRTLPLRVREIFETRWSAAHEASFRSLSAAHRRDRHLFPDQNALVDLQADDRPAPTPRSGRRARRRPPHLRARRG